MSDNGDAIEATTTLHDALDAVRELDRELTRLRADLAAVERERDALRGSTRNAVSDFITLYEATGNLPQLLSNMKALCAALEKPHG